MKQDNSIPFGHLHLHITGHITPCQPLKVKYNKDDSEYALSILRKRHSYGTIEQTMEKKKKNYEYKGLIMSIK
jgi:hypothetical protein